MFPTTLGEAVLTLAALWGLYRLLDPLRRRLERALLALLDPAQGDVIDAELLPRERKSKKE